MKVLVDTSALHALLDEADLRHRDAAGTFGALRGRVDLVTHNYMVVEAMSLVRRRLGPDAEIRLIDLLLPIIDTIWVDPDTHRTAVAAYRAAGRAASLVDHVSFEVMRAEGITYAWAYDRDFEREGFGLPPSSAARVPRRLSESAAQYESASDLVSVAEIAARSGRSVNTVQSWRRRHPDFPAPVTTLAAAPVWAWSDIEPWVARRSRYA
ncbi:MAG TPA: PIN domain-containing protein [Candidatus Limnocylindria bacterium]|nr:PIN domain-containing protein [Candidatus Limnocylindria bacterium]